jgi:hypothetical protein
MGWPAIEQASMEIFRGRVTSRRAFGFRFRE